MSFDRMRLIALMTATGLLAACTADNSGVESASVFGEANRQTMMAQVIDPDPQYDEAATTSAEHAAQAIERYRTDKVKKPDRTQSTQSKGGGS